MKKVLVLFSGGIDSILTAKILKDEGFDITLFNIQHGFGATDKTDKLNNVAHVIGAELIIQDARIDYKEILLHPKTNYGKGVNPCKDCHAFFIRQGWEYVLKNKFHFIATGEVLGQRPNSQTEKGLLKVDELSLDKLGKNISNMVVRPLSGKLLPITTPEKLNWISRDTMLDISGRSKKRQIDMLKEYGLENFVLDTPSTECLLTNQSYAKRFKALKKINEDDYSPKEIQIIRYGRLLKINDALVVLGRHAGDGKMLRNFEIKNSGDWNRLSVQVEGELAPSALSKCPEALIKSKSKLNKKTLDEISKMLLAFSKNDTLNGLVWLTLEQPDANYHFMAEKENTRDFYISNYGIKI